MNQNHYPCRHGFTPGRCLAPACEYAKQNRELNRKERLAEFRNTMTRRGAVHHDLKAFERLSPYTVHGADLLRAATWRAAYDFAIVRGVEARGALKALNRLNNFLEVGQ